MREVRPGSPLHDMLQRYAQTLMMSMEQTAAYNRLHPMEERCARWLLQSHDRVRSDNFPLIHEFLAQMLGVHQATVTVAVAMLRQAGLIRYHASVMTLLDHRGVEERACACYRVVKATLDRVLPRRQSHARSSARVMVSPISVRVARVSDPQQWREPVAATPLSPRPALPATASAQPKTPAMVLLAISAIDAAPFSSKILGTVCHAVVLNAVLLPQLTVK